MNIPSFGDGLNFNLIPVSKFSIPLRDEVGDMIAYAYVLIIGQHGEAACAKV